MTTIAAVEAMAAAGACYCTFDLLSPERPLGTKNVKSVPFFLTFFDVSAIIHTPPAALSVPSKCIKLCFQCVFNIRHSTLSPRGLEAPPSYTFSPPLSSGFNQTQLHSLYFPPILLFPSNRDNGDLYYDFVFDVAYTLIFDICDIMLGHCINALPTHDTES